MLITEQNPSTPVLNENTPDLKTPLDNIRHTSTIHTVYVCGDRIQMLINIII